MSLRVAVALPSIERGALQRYEIDAAIGGLASTGVEIECFAEATRLRETEPELQRWHYLRMPERHARVPFDAALYPLGRDYRPYEPSWILMHQFPGIVWVLDPVLHHLAVGGMVLRGRWDAYRRVVEAAFDVRAPMITDVLSAWWTTSSFYSRHDPVPAMLSEQGRLIASSAAIRDAWTGPSMVATVPLPRVAPRCPPASGAVRRTALLTLNLMRPEPLLRGLRALLQRCPGLEVSVVAPELVYEHRLRPTCDRLGGLEAVSWLIGTDWVQISELVENSDAVALLRTDLTTAEGALLRYAMEAGRVALVADVRAFADLPDDAVVKGSPGEELAHWLPEAVSLLVADTPLVNAVRQRAVAFRQRSPDATSVGAELARQLHVAPGLRPVDLGAATRARLAVRLRRLLLLDADADADATTASGGADSVVYAALRGALGPRWSPGASGGATAE